MDMEKLKGMMASPKTEVVSFDCFDTLVVRPFFRPSDLFRLMDSYVNEFAGSADFFVFSDIRMRAEKLARRALEGTGREEPTLDEIYGAVFRLCPHLEGVLDRIRKLECSLEIKYSLQRRSGKALFDFARQCGKRVIVTSDMYLPPDVMNEILRGNGYEADALYVSGTVGLSKKGGLFPAVRKAEGTKAILHIGDSLEADVRPARKAGLRPVHFPRTADLLCGKVKGADTGRFFEAVFGGCTGSCWGRGAFKSWGLRCMAAAAANRIFDDPYIRWRKGSDFNADPAVIGYFPLGMHLFAAASWLARCAEEEGFGSLNFLARDGLLAYKAFNALEPVYKTGVRTRYTYISRKAVLPLMLRNMADYCAAAPGLRLNVLTPRAFLESVRPVLRDGSPEDEARLCRSAGFDADRPFGSLERFLGFGGVFFGSFFSEEKGGAYREAARQYLAPGFGGRSATFDAGYSGRAESALAEAFGWDITAHYIQTNGPDWFRRSRKSGIRVRRLYGSQPLVTGPVRELFISSLEPSCTGYAFDGGAAHPVFASQEPEQNGAVESMQEAALEFVGDMVRIFGDDIARMPYGYEEACRPFERFLHSPQKADMEVFAGITAEDGLGEGECLDFVQLWRNRLKLGRPPKKSLASKAADVLLPPGSFRRRAVKRMLGRK